LQLCLFHVCGARAGVRDLEGSVEFGNKVGL
jgi:hypothetical protein